MDSIAADLALQAVLGRGGDFVGGIDNEALDFSQLEAFINSENTQGNGGYFGESLNSAPTPTGKLLNVIVENKRTNGHSLPDSPPDSSSEHPYSPQENEPPPLGGPQQDAIYTTLGQPIYKPGLLNPILADNLILGSHIVVAEQGDPLENSTLHLQDSCQNLRLIADNLQNEPNLILGDDTNRQQILIQTQTASGSNDSNQQQQQQQQQGNNGYVENCPRRNGNDLLLVKNGEYEKSQLVHLGFSPGLDMQLPRSGGALDANLDSMVYTNLQTAPKKRKLSQDAPLVKSEPVITQEHCSPSQLSPPGGSSNPMDDDYAGSEACLSESQYQCIRFQAFQQTAWHALCDQNLTELPTPHYRVDADKGFNFSNADDAFVCQKKNHFQITCHVQLVGDAQFVKTAEGFQKISGFHLHFYGVKHDCPTQTIRVEQSQSDRSKKAFHPVPVELVNSQVTKITVGRLHFSETTSNNMRKKGKPNPEQRYFQLVVGLHAHTTHENFPIISYASQKIIVRASNPGQFESDVELCWQKGQTQESIYHAGKVGINTDRPDESLVIHGNLKITGHIIQPSDIRAKKNIVECDTSEQLRNVQKLRVVRYEYEPGFATQLNRTSECSDTGVIAQEVANVIPEAVSPAGDLILENGTSIDNFLVVNKERIFMENIGAVKELCKVTDNLETRIDQLERINRRLSKLKRGDSVKSNSTVTSVKHYPHKSIKGHKCHHHNPEPELCSNKFIQIVIIILVFIMAFCLLAITALYLMEISRQNSHHDRAFNGQKGMPSTHRPTKTSTIFTSPTRPHAPPNSFKDFDTNGNIGGEGNYDSRRVSNVIGKPSGCNKIEEIDNGNLCRVYCCLQKGSTELESPLYNERTERQTHNKSKLRNPEKTDFVKPFFTNDIDKQRRQKRDSWTGNYNGFDLLGNEENLLTITLQGKEFNTTLTKEYLDSNNNQCNYTYKVPVSKYMQDEYLNLIFKSTQTNIKEIEHCYNNYKHYECPNNAYVGDKRGISLHTVNENSPIHQLSSQSVMFEVDMVDYQTKIMTYRASLKQNQNTCKLSATKVGIEFLEYNFYFYRICDE